MEFTRQNKQEKMVLEVPRSGSRSALNIGANALNTTHNEAGEVIITNQSQTKVWQRHFGPVEIYRHPKCSF